MSSTSIKETSVVKTAGLVSLATFFSRILGLVREQVFAFLFGAGNATDAFNIAFRIPNLLRDLFAEGAMSASLVPTFVAVDEREGRRRAWRLAGLVFRTLFFGLGFLTLFAIFYAPNLVALYAGAFQSVPGKFELTVSLTRILFPYFPLVALAAAFMGILNAVGVFFMPAFASAIFNLVSVAAGAVLAINADFFGFPPIAGMAYGVLCGGVAQALCQWPYLLKKGYSGVTRESGDPVWYREKGLRQMVLLMLPGTVGLAATQVNILVNSILATSQGTGAVSWLGYAFRLMQFPIGVFGVAMSVAVFPTVSRLWVSKNTPGVSVTLEQAICRVFAINLPAAAGLAFVGQPIIQCIFEYGRFSPLDTLHTSQALAAYAVGLGFYSVVKVLVPACYAIGVVRIAVISSVLSVLLNLILNWTLVEPLGFWGLALGTSVTAGFNSLFLFVALQRVLRRSGTQMDVKKVLCSFFGYLGVALAMGLFARWSVPFWESWILDAFLGEIPARVVRLTLICVESVGIVLILSKALGLTELNEALKFLLSRVKKKVSAR